MGLFDNSRKKSLTVSKPSLQLKKTRSTGDITRYNLPEGEEHVNIVVGNINQSSEVTKSILCPPRQYQNKPPSPSRSTPPPTSSAATILEEDIILEDRLSNLNAADMETLLSCETQARMDCQEAKEKNQIQQQARRPSKIKFDLPLTPPKSTSPDFKASRRRWSLPDIQIRRKKVNQPSRSLLWSGFGSKSSHMTPSPSGSTTDNNIHPLDAASGNSNMNTRPAIVIGSKVKLYKRPLPIIGTVKYIGKLNDDLEEYLGVELDSGVGNTDGEINGTRYFKTNPNCAIFVRKEDTMKV